MTPLNVTRAIVVASTVVAALAENFLANTYSPQVFWISIGGFVLMLAAGQRLRPIGLPILMAALYLMPSIYLATLGGESFGLDSIWILPMLGLILSDRGALRWSLPARWQWPLVTWAMVVAVSWPIVFMREADFNLWILPLPRVSNSSDGSEPWAIGLNVTYLALAHVFGILWIDALCRWYRDARDRFQREVIVGLVIAAAIASVVAIYQGFVDLTFLNRPFWSYMLRAAGTLGDANKMGAVAGFWTVGAMVAARRMPRPWPMVMTAGALVIGVAAVWVSGSRTGLAAVIVSTMIAAFESIRFVWKARAARTINIKRFAIIGGAALVVAVALVAALRGASTQTVVGRGTLGYVPFVGDRSIAQSANELLWERFGYGPAAIQMVEEHPIDGIGVGMFHSQVHDYGQMTGYTIPQPDNAQNWLRHHIAELGIVGSLPLLWWCVVLLQWMFSRASSGDRLSVGLLRGVLIAFGIASMFGMPAQSLAIVLTFWVFVFWLSLEKGLPPPATGGTWSRPVRIAVVAILVLHGASTVVDAFGVLRPRERAQRIGWFYRYGLQELEPDPGGNPVGRRWTMKDSLAVIPVKGKVLKFVAWVDHPDSDVKPVHVKVWADSSLVYEGDLRRSPLFLDIPATPGKSYMVLETSIDRLFRPSDSGNSRDRRELGLSIRDFVWE